MAGSDGQSIPRGGVWGLVREQRGVVARRQLIALGYSRHGIEHRLRVGRLHRIHDGVYAVGRPELSDLAVLQAALLACGAGAVLSHRAAGFVWGLIPQPPARVEVVVPTRRRPRGTGITIHRAVLDRSDIHTQQGLPLTGPGRTLVDLAARAARAEIERLVNEADKLDLIDPEALRDQLPGHRGRRGVARLRRCLDAQTFTLTDSELERRFLPIVRSSGLPQPQTQVRINGYRVDFFWPELGLIVETDGLRYHRTPAQQARDLVRDQRQRNTGLEVVRFTHRQVVRERSYVLTTLRTAQRRLSRPAGDRVDA